MRDNPNRNCFTGSNHVGHRWYRACAYWVRLYFDLGHPGNWDTLELVWIKQYSMQCCTAQRTVSAIH